MAQPDNTSPAATTNSAEFMFPQEPLRFGADNFEPILAHCTKIGTSDITLQTGEPVIAEIKGHRRKVTKHKLSTADVGDILNMLYGPNGTTQILAGEDVDTHYEFHPSRAERYRFRVNGTGCQVEGHHGIQITLRTIPSTPPKLEELDLQPEIIDAISPREGVVYVTGATGSGKSTLLAAMIRKIVEDLDCNLSLIHI